MSFAGGHQRSCGEERAWEQYPQERSALKRGNLPDWDAADVVPAIQVFFPCCQDMAGENKKEVHNGADQGNLRNLIAVKEECTDIDHGKGKHKQKGGQREQIDIAAPGQILLRKGLFPAVVIRAHADRVTQIKDKDQCLRNLLCTLNAEA